MPLTTDRLVALICVLVYLGLGLIVATCAFVCIIRDRWRKRNGFPLKKCSQENESIIWTPIACVFAWPIIVSISLQEMGVTPVIKKFLIYTIKKPIVWIYKHTLYHLVYWVFTSKEERYDKSVMQMECALGVRQIGGTDEKEP